MNFLFIRQTWKKDQDFHKNIKQHKCFQLILIRKVSWAPNHHIKMISDCSCDAEDWSNSALWSQLSWIWFPLTQTAHHPWTTFPIMHCTHTFPSTITPITTPAPHSLTHIKAAHKHSPSAKSCFPLVTFLSVLLFILLSLFHPGLPDLGSLNLCLWPRLLPGIVYVSALPLIFLFLPADLACLILPIKYCCKWIHSPLTIPYNNNTFLFM